MKISLDIKKSYVESWESTFTALREIKSDYGVSKSLVNYYEGLARGIERTYRQIALENDDFDTYYYIENHSKKMIARLHRIIEG